MNTEKMAELLSEIDYINRLKTVLMLDAEHYIVCTDRDRHGALVPPSIKAPLKTCITKLCDQRGSEIIAEIKELANEDTRGDCRE